MKRTHTADGGGVYTFDVPEDDDWAYLDVPVRYGIAVLPGGREVRSTARVVRVPLLLDHAKHRMIDPPTLRRRRREVP